LDASRQETGQVWPQFLPDGKHYLYFSLSAKAGGVYAAAPGSSETKKIMATDARAWYAPPGFLLFLGRTTLMAQSFDPSKLLLAGSAFPIAEGVGRTTQYGGVTFSASANGTLVYRAGSSPDSTITMFDRNGRRLRVIGQPGQYDQISLSPDGRRLAIDRRDPATSVLISGFSICLPASCRG
jgi:hypothetical protein